MAEMNGAELVEKAQALVPGVHVMLVTGYASADALERLSVQLPILVKPVLKAQFVSAVSAVLSGPSVLGSDAPTMPV
jgi:two-component SAPR family response regulator